MKHLHRSAIVAAIVTSSLLTGVGATAANAQPVTAAVSGSIAGVNAPSPNVKLLTTTSASASAGTVGTTDYGTDRIPIGTIVNWIKQNASGIIPAMKDALRSGIRAFTNWWNGIAGWIRTGISAIAKMSVQELFSELWHHFFG